MYTRPGLDSVIAEWLARAHPSPEAAWREWDGHGVALLPLGARFAAVRMPAEIVHAAVGTETRAHVAVALGASLGGSIIYDQRVAGGTYYALVQAHAGLVWAYEPAICLGHGTYLGVPRIDRQQPPGTYWVVPPRYEGDLCAPRMIVSLLDRGRSTLDERREHVDGLQPVSLAEKGLT